MGDPLHSRQLRGVLETACQCTLSTRGSAKEPGPVTMRLDGCMLVPEGYGLPGWV
jgi:hypothetical protein